MDAGGAEIADDLFKGHEFHRRAKGITHSPAKQAAFKMVQCFSVHLCCFLFQNNLFTILLK
jgi:hypothetical protein